MKYNKGFAPLVVLLIVLGLVVVGGGAYMIGKNASSNTEIIPFESVNPVVQEEVLPVKESLVQKPSSDCTPTSSPSITVLSPNGGETYKAGEKVTVKWKTCGTTADDQVMIILRSTLRDHGAEIATVPNSGSSTITLPTSFSGGKVAVTSGAYYKIRLEVGGNAMGRPAPSDESNNLFTINSQKVSTTLPKYVGSFSICGDGSSLCWPPKITTSSQAYSCNNVGVAPNTEGNDVTTQKVIDGRTYCIHSQSSGYTGGRGYEYTYTTSNGAGTKIATFGINYVSCASYDDPAMSECKTSQNAFKANLDALIDSLM